MVKSQKADLQKLRYRACVGIMVFNSDGLVWAGRRVAGASLAGTVGKDKAGGWWQMPQGGIDTDENPRKAALRELQEETGITSVKIIGESQGWHTYDLPPELLGIAWKGRYKGQKQKWFAARFEGDESEINLIPTDDKHDIEFDAWRWTDMSELVDLIVPFKRDVYRAVIDEFAKFKNATS